MIFWKKWRNPITIFALAGMLTVAAIITLVAAGDLNEASDAQVQIGALSKAAADLELAWFQAMGADALAATGQAPDESQGFYDGAINLYNSSKAVLAAAGIPELDQALAASDQGLDVMNAAFVGTVALAAGGDVVAATDNHMNVTIALYNNVDPAVKGLALVAQAADARLEAKLNSGAATLRVLSGFSLAIAATGAAFAGWAVWAVYRRRDDDAASDGDSSQDRTSWQQAA